jgi:hypothetical protein
VVGTRRSAGDVQGTMRRSLPILVLVLALAACARQGSNAVGDPGSPHPSPDSGVRGRVLAGPQCPVMKADSPCPDKPLEAEIEVQAPNGDVVARVKSGSDGTFEVTVQPGQYVLVPQPPSEMGFPYGKPVHVVVGPHRFTRVTVSFDTGIR